jgi:hypothetical protein
MGSCGARAAVTKASPAVEQDYRFALDVTLLGAVDLGSGREPDS